MSLYKLVSTYIISLHTHTHILLLLDQTEDCVSSQR